MSAPQDPPQSVPPQQLHVEDLYVEPTPAEQATATPAEASQATTTTAEPAQVSEAAKGTVDPQSTVQKQLLDITRQSSPLMERARQSGILSAARRGLQNTSLAAGAAQGAITDRMLPIAQQDAATHFAQQQQNQQYVQETNVRNAEMLNTMRSFNAAESNKTSALNAEMATGIADANASRKTAIAQSNMQEANRQSQFIMDMNTELNKQLLAGTQAMDLADIQGRYNQLISSNASAGQMWEGYFDSIATAMGNERLGPDRVAAYVNVQQKMLESGLAMMETLNNLDLSQWTGMPSIAATTAGYGKYTTKGLTVDGEEQLLI